MSRSRKKSKSGRRSSSKSLSCIRRSTRQPRPIQERVIRYITDRNKLHDGLLIVHGTGCGKTLAAVVASQCYLDKFPSNKVIFLAPSSLLINFEDELKYYGLTGAEIRRKYLFFSFTKFYNLAKRGSAVNCNDSLLIIDEAHNLRNTGSVRAREVLQCAYKAHKRLLLTATPFINSVQDFINLINMIYAQEIAGLPGSGAPYEISNRFSKHSVRILTNLLRGRVDYVPSCRESKDFPELKEVFLKVPMSPAYRDAYEKGLEGQLIGGVRIPNPSKFLHGYRKLVNKVGIDEYYSDKLRTAIKRIKKDGKLQKTVIFTNWINFGVKAIEKFLKKNAVPYRVFRGGLKASEKAQIVKSFNDDDIPVLVITRAGGEGIDLKRVRNIIILDPVWHSAGIEQIIGRAVRYKSHANLPKSQRKVLALKMVLTFPMGYTGIKTGDEMLYSIIERKALVRKKVDKILKQASINNEGIAPNSVKTLRNSQAKYELRELSLDELKEMNLGELKELCRSVGMTKRTIGKSVRSFLKSDQDELSKILFKYIRK